MSRENPDAWQRPDWMTPLEFEALQACARAILAGTNLDVRFDASNSGFATLDVYAEGAQTGQVIWEGQVTGVRAGGTVPVYGVWAGRNEETHGWDVNAIVRLLSDHRTPLPGPTPPGQCVCCAAKTEPPVNVCAQCASGALW